MNQPDEEIPCALDTRRQISSNLNSMDYGGWEFHILKICLVAVLCRYVGFILVLFFYSVQNYFPILDLVFFHAQIHNFRAYYHFLKQKDVLSRIVVSFVIPGL